MNYGGIGGIQLDALDKTGTGMSLNIYGRNRGAGVFGELFLKAVNTDRPPGTRDPIYGGFSCLPGQCFNGLLFRSSVLLDGQDIYISPAALGFRVKQESGYADIAMTPFSALARDGQLSWSPHLNVSFLSNVSDWLSIEASANAGFVYNHKNSISATGMGRYDRISDQPFAGHGPLNDPLYENIDAWNRKMHYKRYENVDAQVTNTNSYDVNYGFANCRIQANIKVFGEKLCISPTAVYSTRGGPAVFGTASAGTPNSSTGVVTNSGKVNDPSTNNLHIGATLKVAL